jgi:hypothetical protein
MKKEINELNENPPIFQLFPEFNDYFKICIDKGLFINENLLSGIGFGS